MFVGLLVLCGIGPVFFTASTAALAVSPSAKRDSLRASAAPRSSSAGPLGVAIVTTVAVSRSEAYLAVTEGADPLVVLTDASSPTRSEEHTSELQHANIS